MKHKSRLGLLLKLQLIPALRSRSNASRRSNVGFTILFVIGVVVILGAFTTAYFGLAYGLQATGLLWLVPALGMVAGCIFNLVTTIYKTNGMLFAFKDYDFIMSLPFPASTVAASRLLIMYMWDLLFMAAVMGPAGIAYAWFAQPGALYWFLFVAALLMAPLIPLIVGSLLGILVSLIASRFRKRNIVTIILTLALIFLYILFMGNIDTIIENITAIAARIAEILSMVYLPAVWASYGFCGSDTGSYLLYTVLSVGPFILYCLLLGHWYRPLNSAVSANRTTSHFEMGSLRSSAPFEALVRREFKRLFGSSQYLLNTCIGQIMGIVLAVILLVSGGGQVAAELEQDLSAGGFLDPNAIYAVVAVFFAFFIAVGSTTPVSISLEGSGLWILRSSPVSTQEILQAKLLFNLIIASVLSLAMGVLLWIAFQPPFLYGIFFILTPLIYGLFVSAFGQWLNLKYARFDWTSETAVLKRSKPVMLASLLGIAYAFAPVILILFAGAWVMFAADAVLALTALLCYRSNMTKGAALFEAFPA